MKRSMLRRLLASLTASAVVVALIGCNVIVGNEDITYTDGADSEGPPIQSDPDSSTKQDTGVLRDADSDVKDASNDYDEGSATDGGSGADAGVGD